VIPAEPVSELREDKLYLVTHAHLSAGYQTAQIAHAVADFIQTNPEIANKWHTISNSLIVLEAEDAVGLSAIQDEATRRGIVTTGFREPDLGDELTAVAFAPGEATRKLLSNLPCAGKKLHNQAALKEREHKLRKMAFAMMACDQTEGQNVLQHGRSVREHYFALLDHLSGRIDLTNAPNWRIPEWVNKYADQIVATLPSRFVMDRYLTLHDCGKPSVLEVDKDGKRHFPDHAVASERVYRETFGEEADETVAYLIAHDMDAHMLKAVDLPEFAERPTAFAHLLAGLAEVTSNAAMFGGTDSTSFKIKFKQLDQRGKALCKLMFDEDGK
jgi:peptidyl-tRNA hydrolase